MDKIYDVSSNWARTLFLSLLLMFFTIPHTLEDFSTGEPIERGIPIPILALVISIVFSLQALGLFWLGEGNKRGLIVHMVVGLFWPIASGFAQLPIILNEGAYRSGFISVFYVGGMIVIGILLFLSSLISLQNLSKKT